jgi:hypothetical protein
VVVSSIVLAELYYLTVKLEKQDLFPRFYERAASTYQLEPFEPVDVLEFEACAAVPEMHDRIIAVLARRLGVPCLTRDSLIAASGVAQTVW